MTRVLALAGVVWGTCSAPVLSQPLPLRLGPVEPCRFDTMAYRDTASFTLYITPPQDAAGREADTRQYAPFVAAVASNFESPGSVSLATWPGTFYGSDPGSAGSAALDCGVGPLAGTVRIELRKGRVRKVGWEAIPDSREVTQALRAAVERADSLGYFLGLRSPPGSRGGAVRLGITMSARTAPPGGWPVLRVRMPYVRIETPPTPRAIPTPVYPSKALGNGIAGT